MLRSALSYVFAAALLLVSQSAFRQALSEFRDTEPGSLLFCALQLVIGTSAVVSAIGLVKRTRWAAPSLATFGVAAAALLAVQPLFEPMDAGGQQSIWLGAAVVGVAAACVSWFAYRLHRGEAVSRATAETAAVPPSTPVSLAEARQPAEPLIARVPDAHVSGGTQRNDKRPHAPGASTQLP